MLKSNLLRAAIALAFAMVFVLPGTAFAQKAQKKISFEEAATRCKAFLDKEKGGLSGGTTSEQHKTARGKACMQKFGHRL